MQNCHRIHVWDCIWHLYVTLYLTTGDDHRIFMNVHSSWHFMIWNFIFLTRNPRKVHERSWKGLRKVCERRILPDPTLAQNGLVLSATSQYQKLFKERVQNRCPEVQKSNVLTCRNTDLPNAIDSVDWNSLITHSRNVTRAALKTDLQ